MLAHREIQRVIIFNFYQSLFLGAPDNGAFEIRLNCLGKKSNNVKCQRFLMSSITLSIVPFSVSGEGAGVSLS